MKQTTKTLATMGGLALLALGIAFAAAWAGKDEEQKTQAKEKAEKLFDLDKAQAREIKLSKAGTLVADLKRADEKTPWRIVAPVDTKADEQTVNAIADKLSTLKQKSELEGMDAKLAGLGDDNHAALAVAVTDAAGKTYTLLAGEENPFDQTLYVKRAGESTIRLVAKSEKAPLDKELFDLRDKRIAQIDEGWGIDKLEVEPEGAAFAAKPNPLTMSGQMASIMGLQPGRFDYALEHEGASWKLTKPVAQLADSGTADRIVQSIKSLHATKVAAETTDEAALKAYGLSFPAATLTLHIAPTGKDAYTRKIVIGQPPKAAGSVAMKTYAKRDDSPTVYEIDGQILKDLSKSLFDLQDKTVLKVDREQVRRLEFTQPGKETVVVARHKDAQTDGGTAEETFALTAPQSGPAKKWKATGVLTTLASLKAAAFVDDTSTDAKTLAKFGLDKPRTVTIFGDKDAVLAKVLLGSDIPDKDKKRKWALVESGGIGPKRVLEIDKSTGEELSPSATDLLEPPPAVPAPPPTPAQLNSTQPAPFVPHASNK